MRLSALALAACLIAAAPWPGVVRSPASLSAADGDDAGQTLERVGEYVAQYLSVGRSILAREQVTLQPLDDRLRPDGRTRRLSYAVQLDWDPAGDDGRGRALVQRHLERIDGRAARDGDDGCLAPSTPEPLAFLLPGRRGAFTFAAPLDVSFRRRPARAIDYLPAAPSAPSLEWHGECGSLELEGFMGGRLIIDPAGFTVLRLQSHLVRPVDIPVRRDQRRAGWGDAITAERVDVSIGFEPVRFRGPDETLMLPSEIEEVTVVRTPEARRLRVTHRFAEYRRFVTGARVEPVPATRE